MAHQAVMLGHNQAEALPPDQLQRRVKDILAANPDLAEAVSFLSNIQLKNINFFFNSGSFLYF